MKFRVIVLARARLDVASIYDWIAERSPESAQRWLDRFEKARGSAETNPLMAPSAPESGSFDIEIRSIVFRTRAGPHIVPFSPWRTTRSASSGSAGQGSHRSGPEM